MKNNRVMVRQGDVLIMSVDSIPDNLTKTKRCTLALGEATGHHHTIHEGATGYAGTIEALAEYFEVTSAAADLTHQEHDTITLPAGKYKSIIQTEYTPERLKNVVD